MKKYIRLSSMLLILFLVCPPMLNAQTLAPMGKGLKYPAVDLYADSSGANKLALQIVSINYDSLLTTYLISKWNGEAWVDVVAVKLQAASMEYIHCLRTMAVYNGEIYIGGKFRGVGRVLENKYEGILRWNGSEWKQLPSLNTSWDLDVYKMLVCGGKLFVAGQLKMQDTLVFVSKWNGSEWSFLNPDPRGYIFDMDILNGKVFMSGCVNVTIDGKLKQGVAIWEESQQKWTSMYGQSGYYLMEVAAKSDTSWLFRGGPTSEQIQNTKEWTPWTIPGLPIFVDPYFDVQSGYRTSNHLAFALNTLWTSMRTSDGTAALFYMDNDRWLRYPSENLGVFIGPPRIQKSNDTLLVCGSFKRNGSTFLDHVAMITEKPLPSMRIHGKVFVDVDNDCKADSPEQGLGLISLKVEPGNFIVQSDKKGEYEIYVPKGKYVVSLLENGPYKVLCKDSLEVDSLDISRNFGIRSELRNHSVSVISSEGFTAPKGRLQTHIIRAENYSRNRDSVLIVYEYDANLDWISSSVNPISHNGHQVLFSLNDIEAFGGKEITVRLLNDTLAGVHTRMKSKVDLHPDSKSKELVKEDDCDSLFQEIIGPYDPNAKQVWPPEALMPNEKVLKYHINFQNVGTAPAMRVKVVDSIDSKLPIENIQVDRCSHDYSLYIDKNVLTWVFDDINLADSASDEKASHGFISYTAKLKEGLPIGTKMKNTAYIYFDWEAPVITNTVENTLYDWPESVKPVKSLSETLKLYPNPASNFFTIENGSVQTCELHMLDLLGRTVWKGKLEGGASLQLNASVFPAGLYFFRDQGHKAVGSSQIDPDYHLFFLQRSTGNIDRYPGHNELQT